MKRNSLICLATLVALLGIGGAVWWISRAGTPMQTATLLDGSTVSFKGVTYGLKHFAPGKPWERLLAFLPGSLASKLALPNTVPYKAEVPSVGFWLLWRPGPPKARNLEYGLADETGFESPAFGFRPLSQASATGSLEGHIFTTFPKRGRTVKLRIYQRNERDESKPLAEFTIPNPAYRSYPSWKPEPTPITRKVGDLEFTLTKLVLGVNPASGQIRTTNVTGIWDEAYFRISSGGRSSNDWQPVTMDMMDATGNQVRANLTDSYARNGGDVFRFATSLWPEEPAWKLRIEFSRKPGAQFQASELWEIKNISIPKSSSCTEADLKTNLHGSAVHFRGLAGAGGRLPNVHSIQSDGNSLAVSVTPIPAEMRLTLVSVKDNRGREVPDLGTSAGSGHYSFGLKWPNDAKTVDIKLALHKSRFAEYLVKPDVAPLNPSSNRK